MTNFTLNQQDTKQLKRCIKDLLTQMTTDYQHTQSERREVAAAFPPSVQYYRRIGATDNRSTWLCKSASIPRLD